VHSRQTSLARVFSPELLSVSLCRIAHYVCVLPLPEVTVPSTGAEIIQHPGSGCYAVKLLAVKGEYSSA
jgi:hypothetical protein